MDWLIIKNDCKNRLEAEDLFLEENDLFVGEYDIYSNLDVDKTGKRVLLPYAIISTKTHGVVSVDKENIIKISNPDASLIEVRDQRSY